MGLTDGLKKIFVDEGEEEEEEVVEEVVAAEEEKEVVPNNKYESKKAAPVTKNVNIVIFEPRQYEDGKEIGQHLRARQAAVVSLKKLSGSSKQRITDFLTGVTFGLGGTTRLIDTDSLLCTPANIGVSGDLSSDTPDAE